jgi:hypothetical protein
MKVNLSEKEKTDIFANDSESLAAIVVVYRMLNTMKEEAKLAMWELMRRRAEQKEDFDFESFIEKNLSENRIDFKLPNFNELKRGFIQKTIYSTLKEAFNPTTEEETKEETKEEPIIPVEIDEKKQKDLKDIMETLISLIEAN